MVGRNERKAVVLGLVLRVGSVTTRDLVERWGLSYSGGQASLEKYRRGSLLARQREPGPGPPVYRYRLTTTGRRKAAWFATQSLKQTRKTPTVRSEGKVKTSRSRVLTPMVHKRRVVRPLIHQLSSRRIYQDQEEETIPKLIRPKIRRRRIIRPQTITVGEDQID